MNPEQWQKIHDLFETALERPAEERAAFLLHACQGDRETQLRVEAMLAADARSDLILDRPAYDGANPLSSATADPDDSPTDSGGMIGVYRIIKELGRGGMGTVYLVDDTRLGRRAALKLLPSHFVTNSDQVIRFQREAFTAGALNHPNIITIYDYGQENGRDYIVSEYIEGSTLRARVENPDLTVKQILDLMIQVASALEAAHAAGIVHRDIKPENIMERPDGYVKVLDFGLAKLTEGESNRNETNTDLTRGRVRFETRTGVVLGTANYMSPEQARGQKVDGRSDLFSLGVILYELVTGQRPFGGKTWHHTIVAITDREPPPIASFVKGAPDALQGIISRALAKDREQRFQSAGAFLSELRSLRSELAADARIQRLEMESSRKAQIGNLSAGVTREVKRITDESERDTARGSFEFLSWIKRYRVAVVAGIVLLSIAAAYLYYAGGLSPSRPALTNRDTILVADFVNTTGDPVFDGTLKQALLVQLQQSPYLNIYPEERARETLGLMQRSRDEQVTREIGREICQRRGIKALLVGTIASLGRNYVITLEAINSQSGEAIANQQIEVEGKEETLKALGRASTTIRERLGESLASIRKFDAPIEQATTASLAAFKDYTIGVELRRKGQYAQSIPALTRATELDKEFALAYEQLGTSYRDVRNLALGNKYLERAYELRQRVSERERLTIAATFFRHITGELDKRIETTSLLTQTFPQDPYGYHLHGNSLMIAGENRQAAEAYREALRLDPDLALARANLALALMGLGRFVEAQNVIDEGLALGQDSTGFHNRLYLLAFLKGDIQSVTRQVEWFAGRPDEYQSRETQARSFAFAGRRQQASATFAQAAALAEARGLLAEKARILGNEAHMNAIFGFTRLAETQTARVLTLLEKEGIGHEELLPSLIQQLDSQPLAWTLAICGERTRAQLLADGLARKLPLDTIHNSVWLPLIRATLELKRGTAGEPDEVVQLLQLARQYEAATSFRPAWVRGQAHLQAKNGTLATVEFQRIIENRGWDVLSVLWPLAHLGVARAASLEGNFVKSRQAYEEFFRLWKEADVDLPVLIEAKREYERLN